MTHLHAHARAAANRACLTVLAVSLALIAAMVAADAVAEPVRLTDENLAFFYEARADIPTPEHTLAAIVSSDYANARDEFTRHDLLQQIRPVLAQRTREAANTTQVTLRIGGRLGDYDFASNSFPTGFSDGAFIPFKHGYAVTFTNPGFLTSLPVDVERARSLSGALRSNRRIVTTIYADVIGAEEKRMSYKANKAVKVRVTGFSVDMKSGQTVGEKHSGNKT